MPESTNLFKNLADLHWQEDPELTLHSWRIRVPCAARGLPAGDDGLVRSAMAQLQIEFMRGIHTRPFCTAIVSPVHDGVRGAEYVIDRRELRALRDLLNASDLRDDDHRETKSNPSPDEKPNPCEKECGAPAVLCWVCAKKQAPFDVGGQSPGSCQSGCGNVASLCFRCALNIE